MTASLISLLLASSVLAADPSATLVFLQGKATVAGRPAKAGDAVKNGETVKTGAKSAAIVEYPDGSRVKLRADSGFKFEVPEKVSGLKGGLLTLGSIFARVTQGEKGHFRIKTAKAVAAVRGTEFFTAFGRDKDLWVCVGKGAVDLSAQDSPGSMVVKEGEGVLLPGGRKTTKPQRYEWTKTLNWNMDPAAGETADTTVLDAAYSDLRDHDYR